MNRIDARTKALDLLARRSADADVAYLAQVNRCIDMAMKLVSSKVPSALLPDDETIVLPRDYSDVDMGRTADISSTDAYVVDFGASGTTNPVTDGTWDGIYHLEMLDPAGQWHRRQVREFWTTQGRYYGSLDRKWRNTTDTAMTYRLHCPEFFTRDDVISVVDGKLWDSTRSVMNTLPRDFARLVDDEDFRGSSTGRPGYMYRSRHFQLDAPSKAPVAAATGQVAAPVTWVGPEPIGKFQYRITYAWGNRDTELLAPGGIKDPQWESSPSPESTEVDVSNTGLNVLVTLPNIDWMVNFDVAGTPRLGHSGLYKILYRRRNTVAGAAPLKINIEAPQVYQRIAVVDGNAETWTDDGSVVPDYYRRLPESHGYYAWRCGPHQDQRYELDLRVKRRPRELANDYDAPRIHPDAESMFLFAILHYICLADRKVEEAKLHMASFEVEAAEYRKNHATAAEILPTISWSPDGVSRAHDPYLYSAYSTVTP